MPEAPYEWNVRFDAHRGGGFAYRPEQMLARGSAVDLIRELHVRRGESDFVPDRVRDALLRSLSDDERSMFEELLPPDKPPPDSAADGRTADLAFLLDSVPWALCPVGEPIPMIDFARARGLDGRPNHVFFADDCSCPCCPPHPSITNHLACWSASPFHASPFHASPFHASPFHASPFHASPFHASGPSASSAQPATAPSPNGSSISTATGGPRVVIFDTGLAAASYGAGLPTSITGVDDTPDWLPTGGGDGYLDPVAGHGTFIAGLVEQRCAGLGIVVERVIEPTGDTDEWTLGLSILRQLVIDILRGDTAAWPSTIYNLSLSGYVIDDRGFLAEVIAIAQAFRITIVASAGNLGSCRPSYPAAYPGVVSVGALGPIGPAEFTNYGDWVRACAPGVDLVSNFFSGFNGSMPSVNAVDPDDFSGWARWSGTSFSAPLAVSALARHMRLTGGSGADAVAAIVDDPGLTRLPHLGTIVNI